MSTGDSFDPGRDPDSHIHSVTPRPTPWRRRTALVEGQVGGIERPGDDRECRDCPDEDRSVSSSRGIFSYLRHNRSLAILLIDTVIVVALFFIVLFVMVPSMGRIRIDDMRINTVVDTVPAMVIVRADFYQRSDRGSDQREPETRIIAVAAGGEILRDLAPSPGQNRTLEISVPVSRTNGETIEIDVFVGEERRTITRSIVD